MASSSYTFTIAVHVLSIALSQFTTDLYYIGQFKTPNPSFIEIIDLASSGSNNPFDLDLVVTNFAAKGTNGVTSFENIGSQLRNISNGHTPPKEILVDHTLTWPNCIYVADSGIFPAETTILIHDGFLVPGHTDGGIYALLLNNSLPLDLIRLDAKNKALDGCFYHNSTMIDMNGDGLKDILLARTCQNIFFQDKGTLIWLEQPQSNPTKPESWTAHELIDGPDILITTQIVNETTIIVFAAQFFTAKLAYYYLRIGVNTPYIVNDKAIIIDDTLGAVYDVQIVDMMKDGNKQLLVNDHIADGSLNGVFLYEIPYNFPYAANNNTFKKHRIAGGFNTTGGVGVGAPGFVTVFDLNPLQDVKTPFKVGIAGDGNYDTWQLTVSNPKTFNYTKQIIREIGGTSGEIAFGDVDGDGWTEVFIPYYEDGIIYVYTANPDKTKYQS